LDKGLGTVVISYPELLATLDLRNDRVSPHKGFYLSMDAQFAGLGGDARDVKLEPEARFYIPIARRITLAARGTIGLLFPQNYGETLAENATAKTVSADSQPTWIHDIQLMFLRGFFSGGSGSNRGYAPREIGPHGVVPFYNPGQTPIEERTSCAVASPNRSSSVCDLPLGGLTLWEASLELRFPLSGPLSAAAFSDTSDVAPYKVRFRFNRPHFSVGLGFRYETPVGPVRFDLGYRVPGLQAPSAPDEGVPSETLGLPIAASFGIGESF
jgi:outer membrane protein insertion porin family/translocation and assembly module TamA